MYVRITVNTDRVLVGLKRSGYTPGSWDSRKGLGKGTKPEVLFLNSYLSEVQVEIGECYRKLQLTVPFRLG